MLEHLEHDAASPDAAAALAASEDVTDTMAASESRFADLIKPLRELAANWQIDIAEEIQQYINLLHELQADADPAAFNFASAALLVQGSTCVYSRKVEHLYGMVFDTLEALQGSAAVERSTSIRENGEDADVNFASEPEFLPLDIPPGKSIDMPQSAEENANGSQLMRPPPMLLSASSSDVREGEGNKNRRPSDMFNVSHLLMNESGALLLEPSNETSMVSSSDRAGDLRFGSPAAMAGSGINSQFGEWQNDGSVEERIPPEPPVFPSDNSEPGGADIFMPDAEPESEYEEEVDEVDMWRQMDPHESLSSRPPRPFRLGPTFRIPPLLKEVTSNVVDFAESQDPLKNTTRKSLKLMYFKEFSDMFVLELKRCKQRLRSDAKSLIASKLNSTCSDVSECDDNAADFDALDDGDDIVVEDLSDVEDTAQPFDLHMDGLNLGEERDLEQTELYEDLVRRLRNEIAVNVARYARCDELLSRVETWRCRIEPLLELETERHSFDIKEYAGHFLDGLGAVTNKVEGAEEGTDDSVSFEQVLDTGCVAASASKFEVCRYFLATLQLANQGNVEIVEEQPGLHLRLLDASLSNKSELEM